ncbi:MAG: hypothetical protein E7043_01040 [Lentisphaerae bacterium]|nr:hypothetical protein [Lentisphaerota bacterium]
MSMYKNIFVNEEAENSVSVQIQGIDGSISNFGEGFTSVEAALAGVKAQHSNAVIRVVSGKYDGYKVVTDGVESEPVKVVSVDFGGGDMVTAGGETMSVAAAGFEVSEQLQVIGDLNDRNAANGTVYVLAGEDVAASQAILVGSGVADYVAGQSADAVYGNDVSEIITLITGVNDNANVSITENIQVSADKTITVGTNGDYTSMEAALAAAADDSSITKIEVLNDITETVSSKGEVYDITQKLTIASTEGKNFKVELSRTDGSTFSVYQMGNNSSVTIDDNLTITGLDIVANGFATSGNNLYINGDISALSLKQWTSNGEIVVSETGKVTLGYGDGQFDMAYGNGSVTVNGTGDKSEAQFKAGYSGTRGNGNTLNLKDTYFEAGAWFNINGSNGTINADNSLLKVSGGDGAGSLTVNSSGNVINMENGSELNVGNVTLGAGNTINIDGSQATIKNLVHNGTFTVSGESTLNIGSITSDLEDGNELQLLDGAVLKDSTINGGTVALEGTATIKGANKVGTLAVSGYNHNLIIGTDGSLIADGSGRTTLSYGSVIDVDGTIAAGAAKSADKTALTKSLDIVAGLSFNGNGTSNGQDATLDVDNAYVSFGSSTSKNSGATGNFVWDFNNSIVDFTKDFQTAASTVDGLDPHFTLNIKDSVFNVADRFAFNHENSVAVVDNSNVVIDDKFRNAGTFTLQNGSVMSVGGNADGSAYTKSGNFGTLNINSGSSLTHFSTSAYPLYNAGTVSVNSGTFEADYVKNEGSFTVSGESTLKIDSVTNTDDDATRIQIADGTTLVDSNVGGYINLHGSLTVKDGLTVDKLRAGYGVDSPISSVIAGDKITVTGSGNLQNGTYTINADMDIAKNIYFENGKFTINSDLTGGATPGEANGAFWINGEVILNDGASMIATNGGNITFNYQNASLTVNTGAVVSVFDIYGNPGSTYGKDAVLNISGEVTASHVVSNLKELNITNGSLKVEYLKDITAINLSVTDDKLASLGKDSYVMVEQTTSNGHPYEFDLSGVGVTYKGETYYVGDSITVGDVIYNVVAGDGNDIAIQAEAKTVVIDSTLTSNGFNKFAQAGEFFELHDTYAERIQGAPEKIVINGENVLETSESKYFFHTDSDITISAGTENALLDVSKAKSFYFMDTIVPNGTSPDEADYSDIATITLEKGVTLKGGNLIRLGQAIDDDDLDDAGNVTRDGGAAHMIVKDGAMITGQDLYVSSYSKLDVEAGGKIITGIGIDQGTVIRAGGEINVTGNGDGTVQWQQNDRSWVSLQGGTINLTDTAVKWNTVGISSDSNALKEETHAAINVKNSTVNAGGVTVGANSLVDLDNAVFSASSVSNAGEINITDSTFKAGKVDNDNLFYIDGESTVQIDDATGTSYAFRVKDGATLNDSYIKAKDNATLRMLGSMTVNGGLSAAYLQGASAGKDGVGGTFKIADDSTVNVSYGVDFSNNYTLDGGKIVLSGGDATGAVWGFVFQNGTFDINTDIEINGGGKTAPLHFTNANAVVRSDISQSNSGGEVIYLKNSAVEVKGGSLTSSAGLHVNKNSSLVVDGGSINSSIVNSGVIYVTNGSTLEDIKISGAGETGYVRAENAVLSNLTVSGQETYTVNTDFNGGTYTGKVYTGYGLVDGEWSRVTDSETTITGTVDASSVYWQNYGKLTIAEGAELKTIYFSEGSRQVLTVNGTISAGTFRGYNGVVSETGKINAQAAVQFYGNPDTKRQYDVNGEIVVTHDIAYAHNIVVGFDTAKQWYGDGPNDYWNIGGANTEVNVSGEKAKLQIAAGKAGKGTAIIHVDEEGTRATLNISDKAQFLIDGKVINNGNLNIANNAVADITGNVTNSGSITVDASSSFSAASIVNNGTFNSDNAGEMIVLGDMTVTGNIQTTDLTLAYGAALSAGSITVTNLTLTIGSTLTLGDGDSTANSITVVGDFNPENAEFILVATNFDKITGHNGTIFYDKDADGIVDDGEEYTIDEAGAGNIIFKQDEKGNLIAKVENAKVEAIYIGDLNGAQTGDKITVTDSEGNKATFTVGTDAFASVSDVAGVDLSQLEEVHLGTGDHVDQISGNSQFDNVTDIIIDKTAEIRDANGDHDADFGFRDLNIDNAGHLEANIKTTGNIDMINSSRNTYYGSMEANDYILDNTGVYGDKTGNVQSTITANDVKISQSADAELWHTTITANNGGSVLLDNGIYNSVDVNANTLNLSNVSELTLDADSVITDNINLGVDANNGDKTEQAAKLTLKGATVNQVTGGEDASGNATGEVIFDGSQLQNTTIEDVDKVVLDSGSHSFGTAADGREYYMNNLEIGDATFEWGYSEAEKMAYNVGTTPNNDQDMIKVTNTDDNAKLVFSQSGEYKLGNFDVSGFGADVTVNNGATIILEQDTDYFAADADLTVDGAVNLKGSDKSVAWDFDGAGAINVNANHDFTAAEALNGFTGTVTVANEKALTLSGVNSTTALFAGPGNIVASADLTLNNTTAAQLDGFNGDIKADGATVTINSSNNTSATFSGAGIVDVQAEQTLNAAGALNELSGTLNNVSTITLKAENTVQATLTGNGSIVAQADQSFTGDVSAYTGSYTAEAGKTVTYTDTSTLSDTMNLNGNGTFNISGRTTAAEITINSDDNATNLEIFNNQVTLDTGKFGSIDGEAGAVIVDGTITAGDVDVADVKVNADKSLNAASVSATDLVVKGEVTAGSINVGNGNISIYVNTEAKITVNGINNFSSANITIYNDTADFDSPYTLIAAADDSTYAATVTFDVNGTNYAVTVNGLSVKVDDKFVQVYTKDGDLLIANFEIKNNVIYVNSAWSSEVGTNVVWNEKQRIVGMDASQTVEQAVEIVRAENDAAEIYVVAGDTYTTPAAMMTNSNGVKNLLLKADNQGEDGPLANGNEIGRGEAQLRGTVTAVEAGLTGDYQFELSNISTRSAVFGGADIRNGEEVANSTTLIIDGGNHMGAQVVGGNFITSATGTYDIDSSKVVIQNTSGDKMGISGRVYGGSMIVGQGVTLTQENAEVYVDLTGGEITMRGDIYAGGSNGVTGNSVTVDNTKVTFTGDADNLTFTGRVSGGVFGEPSGTFAGNSELVFADFNGTFKGLILDMDVITISGNSEVEFSRKQTLSSSTTVNFDLTGRDASNAANAMFTLNSFGWTYGDITVQTGMFASGEYVLASGADFSGIDIYVGGTQAVIGTGLEINGSKYTFSINDNGTSDTADDKLVLNYVNQGLAIDSNSSANVEFSASDVLDANTNGNAVEIAEGGSAEITTNGTVINGNIASNGDLDLNINSGVVNGNITNKGPKDTGNLDVKLTGDVNLNGVIKSSYSGSADQAPENTVVVENADILFNTTQSDLLETGAGDDTVSITNSSVASVTGSGNINLGTGNDNLTVSESTITTDGNISTGTDNDILTVNGGAYITADNINLGVGENTLNLDVDSVLNATVDIKGSDNNDTLNITGFAQLAGTQGAVKLVKEFDYYAKYLQFDGEIVGTAGSGDFGSYGNEESKVKQVIGGATPETDDDVWAQLVQTSDDGLIIAWSNEAENIGDVLTEFNNHTVDLGTAVIAEIGSTSFTEMEHEEFSTKKNNGTLA